MKLALIFRSEKLGYHSIENVFNSLYRKLNPNGIVESVYVEEPGFKLDNVFRLKKFAKTQSGDTIYHVTGDIHYIVFALPRKRTILTIHDCVFINNRKGLKGWVLKKLFLDWPVKYVSTVTAISEKTKNEVISLTGCEPGKIRVINNPVNANIRYVDKPFNSTNPILLFIGSLPNKNLNRVIQSIKGLPCTINIIGHADEQQKAKMDDYSIRYILEKNITNEEMALRYEQADIILFPSLYEGFGLPIIEGFKAGRAVLTSEISPLNEIADGAAWLVDPYSPESIRNTLERIINDEEVRNRKITAGFEIVQQYSPATIASLYNQTYAKLQVTSRSVKINVSQK